MEKILVASHKSVAIYFDPESGRFTATTVSGVFLSEQCIDDLKNKVDKAASRAAKRERPSIPVRVIDPNTGQVLDGVYRGANLVNNQYEVAVGDLKLSAVNTRLARVNVDTEAVREAMQAWLAARDAQNKAWAAVQAVSCVVQNGWFPWLGDATPENVAKKDELGIQKMRDAKVIA